MMLRLTGWAAALVAAAWTDLFLLPSLGVAGGVWTSVVLLSFAARASSPPAGGALGFLLGLVIGLASADPAWPQILAGTAAGALTAWLARAYVSHRSLLSAAATSFVCAAVFWLPPVAVAAADAVRGSAGAAWGAALASSAYESLAAAAVSVPFLLIHRARESRVARPGASWL